MNDERFLNNKTLNISFHRKPISSVDLKGKLQYIWCNILKISPFNNSGAYLVFFKQGSADVAVEGVGEVVVEIFQASLQVLGFLSIVDRQDEEVDEPGQGILVHGLDVGQISNREEKDGRMDSNRCVAHSSCVNLLLSFLSNGLWTKKTLV